MSTNYLVPFFLGTFSGFLATLPIGPAKILAVRKFLILSKGNETKVYNIKSANAILLASISGLIFAQILFFLALQYPFLYSLWVKPHFFSLLFLATIFVYLDKIKNINFDIYSNQPLLTDESTFFRLQAPFLETLFLQLLNPIVLPNPVFCRLNNIFLFRYSTLSTFFAGSFLGLVSGYAIFFVSTLFLLKKLELDAPTIYRLLKIKIHQFFVLVFFCFSFLYLSRSPFLTVNRILDKVPQFSLSAPQIEKFWPDSFFRYDISKRPLRIPNYDKQNFPKDEDIKPLNKMFFSQFFFEGSLKDGKYHLYQNFPPSFSIVLQNINSLINLPNDSHNGSKDKNANKNSLADWINAKKNRQNQINRIFSNKISSLEKGIVLEELVDKKLSSLNKNGMKISKPLDPRLNSDDRGRNLVLNKKSFLFLTEEFFYKKDSLLEIEKKKLINPYTKNKLKLFIAQKYENLDTFPFIPWKPFSQASLDEKKILKETNLNNVDFEEKKSDINVLESPLLKDSSSGTIRGKEISGKLFKNFFISLQNILNFSRRDPKWQNQRIREKNTEWKQDENASEIVPIYKPMPLWNRLLTRDKIKSLNTKGQFLVKKTNYFRHMVLPGFIYSRKCKAVSWNMFQKKAHSPLFLNQMSLLNKFFEKKKKIQINQESIRIEGQMPGRPFPYLRGCLLNCQTYFRKYIKFPFLIILKNITRQLLFQPAEWEKDWTDLSNEVYIDCDYLGKGLSVGVRFANFFTEDGAKQIKIVKPFQLRFWTRSFVKKEEYLDSSENYSFLTVWGQETKSPFGKVKKSPSFLQLLIERIKLILRHKILKNLALDSSRNSVVENKLESPDQVLEQSTTEQSDFSKIVSMEPVGEEKKIQQLTSPSGTLKGKGNNEKNIFKVSSLRDPNGQWNYQDSKKVRNKKQLLPNSNGSNIISNLNKTKKINHTRRYTFESFSIIIQKRWFSFYRFLVKKEREVFFSLKIKLVQMNKFYLRQTTKILKICTQLSYNIYRFLSLVYSQLAHIFNLFFIKERQLPKQSFATRENVELSSNNHLSQAYIIHSIWEDRMMSRPNITCLMKLWDSTSPLKKKLELFLNEQGILGNEKPENLTDHHWKEWLRTFRGYTPSLKLWKNIYPHYWTQAVEQYWQELPSSKLKGILNSQTMVKDYYGEPLEKNAIKRKNNFLDHHLPLFQAVQKQKKLWTFNLLSHVYTDLYNDGDVDSFFIWKNADVEKKMNGFFDRIKKVKDKNKNFVVSPATLSSLIQIKNKSNINNTQQDILENFPIIQREKKRLDLDRKLETIQERVNFFPVSTKRWKVKKLKKKLHKLARIVLRSPDASKVSYSSRKVSYSFNEKNKKMLRELFQSENMFFSTIFENWNSKVLDDELLMYNIVSSLLKFTNKKRSSVNMDHSSSLSPIFQSNSVETYFLLPEEIFLPNHLRELRILDSLDFENNTKNIQNILPKGSTALLVQSKTNYDLYESQIKEKSFALRSSLQNPNGQKDLRETSKKLCMFLEQDPNSLKSRQTIVRFLWPTHRLEDLACINRFWMGATPQSRFSLLRIQNIP